jgi:hypothetical protein
MSKEALDTLRHELPHLLHPQLPSEILDIWLHLAADGPELKTLVAILDNCDDAMLAGAPSLNRLRAKVLPFLRNANRTTRLLAG